MLYCTCAVNLQMLSAYICHFELLILDLLPHPLLFLSTLCWATLWCKVESSFYLCWPKLFTVSWNLSIFANPNNFYFHVRKHTISLKKKSSLGGPVLFEVHYYGTVIVCSMIWRPIFSSPIHQYSTLWKEKDTWILQ